MSSSLLFNPWREFKSDEVLYDFLQFKFLCLDGLDFKKKIIKNEAHCHAQKKYNKKTLRLPLSTLVIDMPRRGVRITRKHRELLRNFIKLRLSLSLSSFLIAAAFRSISEDLHDEVDEFCESRRESLRKQMQLLNIFHVLQIHLCTQF